MAVKVGRNDTCPCGSGRKYKHCCLRKGVHNPFSKRGVTSASPALLRAGGVPPTPPRSTLRGAAFTQSAATAVSHGWQIPELDLHPWIVAQLRERTRVGPGGRPPAWTISRVREMETPALDSALARLGVHLDRAAFTAAAEGQLSAWELSLDWDPVEGADAEFLGLVACELWRRWLPEVPSLEMIDERMQDGYDALERGDGRGACAIWLEVWSLLLDTLPDASSVEALDEGFVTGLNRIGNWVGDVSIELRNLAHAEPELARRARAVYRVAAERLGDRHVRGDLAELHYALGETEAGEAVLESLIRDDPDDPGGYALLSDHLGWGREPGHADVPRAIALLETALARPVRDATSWDLARRLEDLRERRGAG